MERRNYYTQKLCQRHFLPPPSPPSHTTQSLASSPAARDAGLDPVQVLGALTPARRSMVGTLHSSTVETMAGLLVALAEVRQRAGSRGGGLLGDLVVLCGSYDSSARAKSSYLRFSTLSVGSVEEVILHLGMFGVEDAACLCFCLFEFDHCGCVFIITPPPTRPTPPIRHLVPRPMRAEYPADVQGVCGNLSAAGCSSRTGEATRGNRCSCGHRPADAGNTLDHNRSTSTAAKHDVVDEWRHHFIENGDRRCSGRRCCRNRYRCRRRRG